MVSVAHDAPRFGDQSEDRLILHGVSWEKYATMRELLDDHRRVKMTYLAGTLELLSPSDRHEWIKKTIARLIEVYALERDVRLNGYGSTTFKNPLEERGLEPDECYCFGLLKEVPDIALEVIITSGGVDKLAVYQGLGVPEVWFWKDGSFSIHILGAAGYEQRGRGELVPELDFEVLAQFAEAPDQHEAVQAFRDLLRRG
jgi:Uma2 family endonuclease